MNGKVVAEARRRAAKAYQTGLVLESLINEAYGKTFVAIQEALGAKPFGQYTIDRLIDRLCDERADLVRQVKRPGAYMHYRALARGLGRFREVVPLPLPPAPVSAEAR